VRRGSRRIDGDGGDAVLLRVILRPVPPRPALRSRLRSLAPLALALLAACSIPPPSGPTSLPIDRHRRAPLERHLVTVEGHRITVWAKSPLEPTGAIVLVHGRTWSALPDFDLQVRGESHSLMDALVAEGLVAYAIDQRGYGATPRDDTGFLTPDRAEADLTAVLAWVHDRHPTSPPPAALGWSLGSLTSQLVAQRHPELVSALVLYGYPRRPGQEYPPDLEPFAQPARVPTTPEGATEDFITPGSISPAAVDAFVRAALAADPVKMDWRSGDQWNALDPAAIHTPTLVIHGERDPYAPVFVQAELFSLIGHPDRAWVILPGSDHVAHLEAAGPQFVHAVVEFLRRPTATSAP
jgi:pimeloyl-ACP methyl ester carboxylesterase